MRTVQRSGLPRHPSNEEAQSQDSGVAMDTSLKVKPTSVQLVKLESYKKEQHLLPLRSAAIQSPERAGPLPPMGSGPRPDTQLRKGQCQVSTAPGSTWLWTLPGSWRAR